MEKPWFRVFLMAAATLMPLITPMAYAAQYPAAGTPQAAAAKEPRVNCLEGWERLLPGDYYGCRALYHLQRHHPERALGMLKEAAYWANKDAQHVLGLAYVNGNIEGIPANRPLGIAWLALAAERKHAEYVHDYTLAVRQSSPGDVSSASTLYVELKKVYGDRVAGERATRRFVREVKSLDDAANEGGNMVHISGLTPYPEAALILSQKIHEQAKKDFDGLQGTVSVGVLEQVAAPRPALRDKYKGLSSGN
ncbi:hypothetical protein PY254_04305 [Rhodanobacter sp. AS-Z3]|uniref:hypothetical protein n=1 Tax=Rhodanobacter sp. AS-Z3 TaxID=3031330 RepID=UPI002479D6B3|nr:hypothetical protein [Rhodanobacter sp. AS-Z3]WEN15901.1 hypothetical protein PY254_04305 [Rhodanobacter sp. AS-Z3]